MPEYIVLSTVPMESLEELIRCKDCKHFCNEEENYISEEGFAESECMYMPMARENDYCSRAERKEE